MCTELLEVVVQTFQDGSFFTHGVFRMIFVDFFRVRGIFKRICVVFSLGWHCLQFLLDQLHNNNNIVFLGVWGWSNSVCGHSPPLMGQALTIEFYYSNQKFHNFHFVWRTCNFHYFSSSWCLLLLFIFDSLQSMQMFTKR